jgi:hypothetical protein
MDFSYDKTHTLPQQTMTTFGKFFETAPRDLHVYAFVMGGANTLKFVFLERRRGTGNWLAIDELISLFQQGAHNFTLHRSEGTYQDYMDYESRFMDRSERIGMKSYFQVSFAIVLRLFSMAIASFQTHTYY